MPPKAKKAEKAPVEKYEERPLEKALADQKEIEAKEDRQPDQIADYHDTHKTWKAPVVEEPVEEKTE